MSPCRRRRKKTNISRLESHLEGLFPNHHFGDAYSNCPPVTTKSFSSPLAKAVGGTSSKRHGSTLIRTST